MMLTCKHIKQNSLLLKGKEQKVKKLRKMSTRTTEMPFSKFSSHAFQMNKKIIVTSTSFFYFPDFEFH